MDEKMTKASLQYIDAYWDRIIRKPARRRIHGHVFDIPRPYFIPNEKKFNTIYYWDSYFMMRGIIGTKRAWIMKDMVENFAYLFEKYQIIPNFSALASTGRSQPPFLSSMILDTYESYHPNHDVKTAIKKLFTSVSKGTGSVNKVWLKEMIAVAKKEYANVWLDPQGLYYHSVDGYDLNRYGDRDIGYAHSSELESGWDFTSRFYNRCDEFFPVDLNIFLYKYEKDFAKAARILDQPAEEEYWEQKSVERKRAINKYCWNDKEGFFYDYNYITKRQSIFLSLAGFTPLWAGLASPEQAARLVEKIPLFETKYGLVITTKNSLAPKVDVSVIPIRYRIAVREILEPKQWDYPNIWPPLEYLTVIGLLRYGYVDVAQRIMKKSIAAQNIIFKKYGTFFEKISCLNGDITKDFHYIGQSGFGWTNAIYYRYVQILNEIHNKRPIYKEPLPDHPPYGFTILH